MTAMESYEKKCRSKELLIAMKFVRAATYCEDSL
jgi:hypothetical protein